MKRFGEGGGVRYKGTKPSDHPTTICYKHRPQHFKVTVRLFTAEGHHRFHASKTNLGNKDGGREAGRVDAEEGGVISASIAIL